MLRYLSIIAILQFPLILAYSQSDCEKLKSKAIDFSINDTNYIRQQLWKLTYCGFDSIDCEMAGPLAGSLLFARLNENKNKKTSVTYGDVVCIIKQLKQTGGYQIYKEEYIERKTSVQLPTLLRDTSITSSLCDTPLHKDKFDPFNDLPQYFDYRQALQCAQARKKRLCLYFTANFGSNCRKMEKEVLNDPTIKKILQDEFVIVTLYIDGEHPESKNNFLLQKKMGSEGQPAVYIIDVNEKILGSSIGYTPKESFLNFLQK